METKFELILKRVANFIFPWRDVLGIFIGGIPFRLGEIFTVFFILIPIKKRKITIYKSEGMILLFLLLNLFLSVLGFVVYHSSIDTSFSIKYILRNFCFLLMFIGFLSSNITMDDETIDRIMKFFVIVLTILCIIQETTWIHFYMGRILTETETIRTGQYINLGGLLIPRFVGVCSEAGYLAPILVMPLYYYLNIYFTKERKEKRKAVTYILLILGMAILTFSSAVYAFVLFIFIMVAFRNLNNKKRQKTLLIIILLSIFSINILWNNSQFRQFITLNMIEKINGFISLGKTSASSWSANDRVQHLLNAWELFMQGDALQFLIGHGTGAYSKYASTSDVMVQNVEDAYNIYLSTLCDRGVIGLLLFVAMIISIRKFKHNTISSKTINIGILAQLAHWIITGNFWLYYFWYEIMFLIAYNRWYQNQK